LSAPWPIEEHIFKGEMGNDSDLREQILEAAEEEDVSGQLLQQAASTKGKPLSETCWAARFDSLSAIIANYSKIYESLIKIEVKISGDAKSNASGHGRIVRGPQVHNCNRGSPVCSVIFETLNTFPSKDKLRYGCCI